MAGSRPARSKAVGEGCSALSDLVVAGQRAVVLIRPAGGERNAARTAVASDDKPGARLLNRLGARVEPGDRVVGPRERETLIAPAAPNDLDLLLQHVHALALGREREAIRPVLGLEPSGAHPEVDAPARYVIGGHNELGEHGRVAKGCGRDERSQPDARGGGGQRADRAPRVERRAIAAGGLGEVVIGAVQPGEAVALGCGREVAPLGPGHALLALDHQADLHGSRPRPAATPKLPHSSIQEPKSRPRSARRSRSGCIVPLVQRLLFESLWNFP